ncbi:nutritionally-regulated adipose and cardiac enriched protein homolog isoform X2 [Scleropages formosus]|uniref:nutritionally-regulated adipose and cardiac enriched protein homolog isoform X2 n=1 Tax=Scleropages formosus TaxID=113540 RepID=UPI000878CAEA|nr:nutritionally-regulated adipose and cardiac enriched protein homolog isoform X2 [Scleropages formosus]
MLSGGREGLYELGSRLQQQGESRAALRCFLSCLLGLPHVHSFRSLPDCLHQIAELFIEEKNYVKALRFIQAEKMFYEVALIELTALQGNAGAQEASPPGSPGWDSPEEPLELSELASQAQDYERLAQLCIMSKRPHLALEYSGKATKIRQKAFGNDHPITARSLELLASVYAEIGKTEYSDSLGQCVSALSKRFATNEPFSNALNGTASTRRVRHHHRKDPHPPEEAPKPQVSTCKFPTSILKRSNLSGSDTEPTQRRKSERRVRFREPENVVHDYDGSPCRPHLALFACFFLLLSVLGVALYCTDRRRPLRMCEELEALLAVYLLQMKQVVWACWIWLTMQ